MRYLTGGAWQFCCHFCCADPAQIALVDLSPATNAVCCSLVYPVAIWNSAHTSTRLIPAGMSSGLEVSLNLDGVPSVGDSIMMCVTITNQLSSPRVLMEHLDAQLKKYNSSSQESFWRTHNEVHIQPGEGRDQQYNTECHRIWPKCGCNL